MCLLTVLRVLTLPDGDTNVTHIITYMYHAQTPRQAHWVPTLSRAWRCTDFTLKVCIGPLLGLDIRRPTFCGASSMVGKGRCTQGPCRHGTLRYVCVHAHMWVYTQHAWREAIVKLSRGKAEFR